MEAADEPVEVEVSPLDLRLLASTKTGLVSDLGSNESLDFSKTPTSDIVGLIVGEDCMHTSAISMIFFTVSASYSYESNVSSTNSM